MDKAANADLLRQALLGLLAGGGTYGALRLGREMGQAAQPPQKPKDELQITLPSSRMPKMGADAMDYIAGPAAFLGAGAGGFLGASKLYEMLKKKQIANEQQGVEQNYLHTLQQAHQKTAASTPHIDKFLEGLIEKAGESLKKDAMFGVDFPSEGVTDMVKHQGGNLLDSAAHSDIGSAGIAAWLAAALGTGGLTYGIAKNMDNNKKRNQERSQLPSEVRLNVA